MNLNYIGFVFSIFGALSAIGVIGWIVASRLDKKYDTNKDHA